MIRVTRLNREELIINSDLIELIEITPDTVLTLTTGKKFVVRESADEIIERVLDYRRHVGIRVAHPGMTSSEPAGNKETD
jgi:flagellar protein FlbD